MEPIDKIRSKTVVLDIDHLDNNEIIPSFFARKTTKKDSAKYLFNNLRYLPGLPKRKNPEFPLNNPEAEHSKILLPGKYFATEIEYEQAVWAILDEGFKVVISNNIGYEFKKHSYRNGLLPIEVTDKEFDELKKVRHELIIDLTGQQIETEEKIYFFEVDQSYKEKLINGLDDVEETLDSYEEQLLAYEKRWNRLFS